MEEQKPKLYKIHSMAWDVSTKAARHASPIPQKRHQLLGGGTINLRRGRPVVVSGEVLAKLMPELIKREVQGVLMVTNMAGERLNLETGQPVAMAAGSKPLPIPVLDSAADDLTYPGGVGVPMPNLPGGKALGQPIKHPRLLEQDIPEGEEEVEGTALEDFTLPPAEVPPDMVEAVDEIVAASEEVNEPGSPPEGASAEPQEDAPPAEGEHKHGKGKGKHKHGR